MVPAEADGLFTGDRGVYFPFFTDDIHGYPHTDDRRLSGDLPIFMFRKFIPGSIAQESPALSLETAPLFELYVAREKVMARNEHNLPSGNLVSGSFPSLDGNN